jgi:molybdate transport system substrate-binding protein
MKTLSARLLLVPLLMLLSLGGARAATPELLIYCGITMVRPMGEIAKQFEAWEKVKVILSQGGSEDLYQSARKSRQGDLYLPGEPTYRARHLAEGLLGDFVTVGHNQLAIVVAKGNPRKVKGNPRELLRDDLSIIIGNAASGSVGKETKDILDALGIHDQVVDKALYLSADSRELASAMRKGTVDATLNWRAVAFFPDNVTHMDVVDLDPRLAKPQALLLNLLTFSREQALARKFMAYAAGPEGQAIFRRHGFLDNNAAP